MRKLLKVFLLRAFGIKACLSLTLLGRRWTLIELQNTDLRFRLRLWPLLVPGAVLCKGRIPLMSCYGKAEAAAVRGRCTAGKA